MPLLFHCRPQFVDDLGRGFGEIGRVVWVGAKVKEVVKDKVKVFFVDFGKKIGGMQKLRRSTHKIIWRISTLIKIQTILKLFIHRLPGARGDEIVKICLMK